VAAIGAPSSTLRGPRYQRPHQLRWWLLLELPPAPPKGPTIDVLLNFGGGRCRSSRQHLVGGPPSTSSSTSVVAAARAPSSTPQGGHHRRLAQLRWWPLPELPVAPCREPAIVVLINFGGGRCRSSRQHPQGAHHQRLAQLRWWPLSELPAAPPRGAAIDVWLNLVPVASTFLATPTKGPLW
jgi:hypothetical protein